MPFTRWEKTTTVLTANGCPFPVPSVRRESSTTAAPDTGRGGGVGRDRTVGLSVRCTCVDFTFDPAGNAGTSCAEAIIAAGIQLRWSAECRVDVLDEALLDAMRRAGCEVILVGIETGDEEVAGRLGKSVKASRTHRVLGRARALGIRSCGHFVLGSPDETRATGARDDPLCPGSSARLCVVQSLRAAPRHAAAERAGRARQGARRRLRAARRVRAGECVRRHDRRGIARRAPLGRHVLLSASRARLPPAAVHTLVDLGTAGQQCAARRLPGAYVNTDIAPGITVVIPARDEESGLLVTLAALRAPSSRGSAGRSRSSSSMTAPTTRPAVLRPRPARVSACIPNRRATAVR